MSWDSVGSACCYGAGLAWLTEKGFAKASVARRDFRIRSFYRYLRTREIVETNPSWGSLSPKLPRRLPRYLNVQETAALLAAPDPSTPLGPTRDTAILELLYGAGVQVGELVSLDTGHLDLGQTRSSCTG